MRRNPFVGKDEKFKIKPSINSEKSKDEVARRLMWAYIGYWGVVALWLIVSYTVIPMIFYLGAIMLIAGGLMAMKIPTESANIGRKTRLTVLTYMMSLLAFKVVILVIQGTPVEAWEKVLRMNLPDAFNSTFMGFLSMAFMVAMFMGFIAYLGYLGQLIMFHRSDKGHQEHIKKLMRKEDDNR